MLTHARPKSRILGTRDKMCLWVDGELADTVKVWMEQELFLKWNILRWWLCLFLGTIHAVLVLVSIHLSIRKGRVRVLKSETRMKRASQVDTINFTTAEGSPSAYMGSPHPQAFLETSIGSTVAPLWHMGPCLLLTEVVDVAPLMFAIGPEYTGFWTAESPLDAVSSANATRTLRHLQVSPIDTFTIVFWRMAFFFWIVESVVEGVVLCGSAGEWLSKV